MARIQIIIGSVTGQAQEVAEAVASTLEPLGHNCRLNAQFKAGDLAQSSDEVVLICTSNTGVGDLPANIAPFYQHLTVDFPNIAGRRYGLINLGDSSYPSFAEGGARLDEAMADIGAVRVGEPCVIDAIYVQDHCEQAQAWAQQWGQQL